MRILKFVFAICVSLTIAACSSTTVKSVNYYDKKVVELPVYTNLVSESIPKSSVIILHGSGGIDSHHREWSNTIKEWGYNSVLIESFKPRGISDVNGRPYEVPFLQRAIDAEMVARWVKLQKWSNGKICVIGFSHGGVSVLNISSGQLETELDSPDSFECGVNYYGYPVTDLFFADKLTMPTQIHVGTKDGSNDLSKNKDYANKYSKSAELFIYDGAEHGFDRSSTDITVRGTDGLVSGGYYRIKSDVKSKELSQQRVKEFLNKYLN